MAFTAPRTWVVGELVTAAIMNTFIRDNQNYLNTWVQNDVTGARAIDATVYQNTDEKILFVSINIRSNIDDDGGGDMAGNSLVTIHVGAATPPLDQVARLGLTVNMDGAFGADNYTDGEFQAFFVVLPNYYYKATASDGGSGAAPTLQDWFEWSDS